MQQPYTLARRGNALPGQGHFLHRCPMPNVRDEIVRACIAEMREKLACATPETRDDADVRILLYSGILATFKAEQVLPTIDLAA